MYNIYVVHVEYALKVVSVHIDSMIPSDAYMRRYSNHHWLR